MFGTMDTLSLLSILSGYGVSVILLFIYMGERKKRKRMYSEVLEHKWAYRVLQSDITEASQDLYRYRKDFNHIKHYDSLTGLPNGVLFTKDLSALLQKPDSKGDGDANGIGVILINIDNYKNTVNTIGYDHGNQLLILISEYLKAILNEAETGNGDHPHGLYHLGSDKYVILIDHLDGKQDSDNLLTLIENRFDKSFEIGDKLVYITLSIGVAIYPKLPDTNQKHTLSDIINAAEIALHESKKTGKNKYTYYEQRLSQRLLRNTQIEKHLHQALVNNELTVVYQPQINLSNETVAGYEALLRWNNPVLGPVSPSEFIPIAEESLLMDRIGEWVLRHVCQQNKHWLDHGMRKRIAVNISAVQFEQEHFFDTVVDILQETGLPAVLLELEITETALIHSVDRCRVKLKMLQEMGIVLALDDFGTGYSSLNYLRRLPISNLKIDKSFIDDLENGEDAHALLDGMIKLASSLKLNVIAEGVETSEQVEILRAAGCDIVQGYYYSKPVPAAVLDTLYSPSKQDTNIGRLR